jgi:hypothetical protein
MEIRKTKQEELDTVMAIYAYARQFMADNGNPNQWKKVHPPKEMIKQDISEGKCYVGVEEGKIAAVFYFAIEEDPTYGMITDGAWKNNRPYAVVHRVASAACAQDKDTGTMPIPGAIAVKGAAATCLQWAAQEYVNIRMDTHTDNVPMQGLLKKCGFEYCGIIFLENGDERMAYQKVGYEKQKAFLGSLDFMKIGQAINHNQWPSAAMIIQRMSKNAKDAGMIEFDRLFTGIRQNINRKNAYEAKQLLALVVNKRAQLINILKTSENHKI